MKPYIHLALRIFLGAVFLIACWDKILHPQSFAEVIYNYQILPGPLINITALVLPVLELLLALALILGIWLPGTLFLANLLLAVFFSALLFNTARGLDIHCGCFSTDGASGAPASTSGYLFRDVAFLAVSLFLLYQHYREKRAALV
jgi:uncharacterized membrane protein YphA (DoxX/SURF4 family)